MLALILSDVVGDPLQIIASGPTVPHQTDTLLALQILTKYRLQGLQEHTSVSKYLASATPQHKVSDSVADKQPLNLIIGSNKMAVTSAKEAAISCGYACYVWSRQVQGEAKFLGEVYAILAHCVLLKQQSNRDKLEAVKEMMCRELGKLSSDYPQLEADILNLIRTIDVVEGGPFCLLGAGEPTVTVTGKGRGGRNQELALAYLIKLHELRKLCNSDGGGDCLFASIGTDGQDGPCDAAGAVVDPLVFAAAQEQGLDPPRSLSDNDSYTFFSAVNSGKNLIKTGLTGTNVMDIHILLMK